MKFIFKIKKRSIEPERGEMGSNKKTKKNNSDQKLQII